jgi:hypothetical protein
MSPCPSVALDPDQFLDDIFNRIKLELRPSVALGDRRIKFLLKGGRRTQLPVQTADGCTVPQLPRPRPANRQPRRAQGKRPTPAQAQVDRPD